MEPLLLLLYFHCWSTTRHLLRVVNSEALFPFWKNQRRLEAILWPNEAIASRIAQPALNPYNQLV